MALRGLRSRRVVRPTPRRARHGAHSRRDHRGYRPRGAARSRCDRRRRARDLARDRRLPRPHERARTHRVGRVRDRHARRGRGRRHHRRRHAAQLHAGHDDARRARREARGERGPLLRRRRLLGRRRSRQHAATWRAWPRAGCSAARRSSFTRGSTTFPTRPSAIWPRAMPVLRDHRPAAARARGAGSRRSRHRAEPAGPTAGTCSRAPRRGRTRPSGFSSGCAGRPAAPCTSSTCLRPRRSPTLRAARAEGLPVTVGDLPALPVPRGGVDSRRRDPVQVRAADPRPREPRGALAGPLRRGDRLRGHRSQPVHAGAQAAGARRLRRAWGGIASLQLGLPAVWTEARRRGRGICGEMATWMSARPAAFAGAPAPQGASRRLRRRSRRLGSGRELHRCADAAALPPQGVAVPRSGALGPGARDVPTRRPGLRWRGHPAGPVGRRLLRRDGAGMGVLGVIDPAPAFSRGWSIWPQPLSGAAPSARATTSSAGDEQPGRARTRRLHRGEVHRPRQVDGRLGEPAQARSRRRARTTGASWRSGAAGRVLGLRHRHAITSWATARPSRR